MRNLMAEMVRSGVSRTDIQRVLDCSEATLRNKLSGRTVFTYPEAKRLKDTFFPDLSLEDLFADEAG